MATAVTSSAARCRAVLPSSVVARGFVAETVLLDVSTGRFTTLDGPAGELLDALLGEATLAAAAAVLAARDRGGEQALLAELVRLARGLEALGLLRLEEPR